MDQVVCQGCTNVVPATTTRKVAGQVLCQKCFAARYPAGAEVPAPDEVQPVSDSTVCAECGFDNGSTVLPIVNQMPLCLKCAAKYNPNYHGSTVCCECGQDFGSELATINHLPICPTCELKYRRKPFPVWVKASFAAVLLLTATGLIRYVPYLVAHLESERAAKAWSAGNVEQAMRLEQSALSRVPWYKPYQTMAPFFEGVYLLTQDKSAEAVAKLREVAAAYPKATAIQYYLLCAEAGEAFDKKDYDRFLERSEAQAKMNPEGAVDMACVSSAYACKYAVTGNESFRTRALDRLDLARMLSKPAEKTDFENYSQRILYRLDSREIITKKEYDQKFPNGYKKE